jgi:hypothetical protein
MHVALGWPYRGHDVIQGAVVYLALEGGRGFAKRIVAFRQEFIAQDSDPVPFWLIDVRIDLIKEHTALIAAIRSQLKQPAVVVIDTLNRALNGSENDDKDMGKFIAAADEIRDAFRCLVVIIHHPPLTGGRPRGHSSLGGADDCQISVEKNDASGIVTCKVVHMKDEYSDLVLASKLKRIEIGTDSKGNPITSCTVEPVALNPSNTTTPNLPKTQRFALDALKKALAGTDGVKVKTDSDLAKKGIPVGTRVCKSEIWRQQFYDTYPAATQEAKKKALFRATLDLTNAGLILLAADYAWIPE